MGVKVAMIMCRLPEEVARFYAAEVMLAFEYMHDQDIVYRDLKVTLKPPKSQTLIWIPFLCKPTNASAVSCVCCLTSFLPHIILEETASLWLYITKDCAVYGVAYIVPLAEEYAVGKSICGWKGCKRELERDFRNEWKRWRGEIFWVSCSAPTITTTRYRTAGLVKKISQYRKTYLIMLQFYLCSLRICW